MPLARQQHDIMLAGVTYGRKNGAGTILNDLQPVRAEFAGTAQDLRDDGGLEGEITYHNGDETTFIAVPWTCLSAAC